MLDVKALEKAGFVESQDRREALSQEYDGQGLTHIAFAHVFEREGVAIIEEQNVSTNPASGQPYPAVARVEGPAGSVTCDPRNTKLLLTLAGEVAQGA